MRALSRATSVAAAPASSWGQSGTITPTCFTRGGPAAVTQHTLTGLHRGIIANRVSYTLGVHGPSLTVDAVQSSALVAVHMACESLRHGESTLAIAGGVNLNIIPETTLSAARSGGLSPDGRCFTFDARANGFVRGEGGAAVVLKPLARAVTDGDPIYCVIRGTAVNNDGTGEGLVIPDPAARAAVLRRACQQAGVRPADVQYVELNGTGTATGDPLEAAALGAVFSAARNAESPLLVGSAKTNVGHLEGAAGLVGLLKAALCIKHRQIPPSLNFETPNPDIPLDELRLRVQDSLTAWPRGDRPLVAGVSSFGVGGTNCHAVLCEPPAGSELAPPPPDVPPAVPWVVSGRSPHALEAQARRLTAHLTEFPHLGATDVGFSLATTRTAFEHRAVVVSPDREELLLGLDALAQDRPAASLVRGTGGDPAKIVFVFPGQGSQWPGMAVHLLDTSAVFRKHMLACADALAPHVDWSLIGVLRGAPTEPPLVRDDVREPVLFAVMVSLARLWQSAGVQPSAIIGHSQGEIAAACVAGALSLQDAARIVVLWSRTLEAALAGSGAMAHIPAARRSGARPAGPLGGPAGCRRGQRAQVNDGLRRPGRRCRASG